MALDCDLQLITTFKQYLPAKESRVRTEKKSMTSEPKWKRWTRESSVSQLRESNQVLPDRRLVAVYNVLRRI